MFSYCQLAHSTLILVFYLGNAAGAVDAANKLVVAATVLVTSVVSSLAGL